MRVWIDLANSPHVPLFVPIVERLRERGDEVLLTARDHAQTVPLAREVWPDIEVVGTKSPAGLASKAATLGKRALALRRVARPRRPDVALSHGSYAQIVAARAAGIRTVTMMDYEYQPANHLSFRLAHRVVVPRYFPEDPLRRFGARERKVLRYDGFKEELYLAGFRVDDAALSDLGVDDGRVVVVMRPPPAGALYHRHANERFDELLELARRRDDVHLIVLPRGEDQARELGSLEGVHVPERIVDGRSLLARADVVVGAGGTMNREAALLGTPTYTVFLGRLAAVDAELMRQGKMHDLREDGVTPSLERKVNVDGAPVPHERAAAIMEVVDRALES